MKLHRIDIQPVTWKRTQSNGKMRFMPAKEREYYIELEAAYRKIFKPFPTPPIELKICLEFHFKHKRWADIDNLIKAIFDAGQPSKYWLPKTERQYLTDFWTDEQFRKVVAERFRGSDGNYILIGAEVYNG